MRARGLGVLLLGGLLSACGAPEEVGPSVVAPSNPQPSATVVAVTPPAPARDVMGFDPVAMGLSAAGQKQICDEHLKAAEDILATIKSLKGAPPEKLTWDATMGAIDALELELADAVSFPGLMEVAHPDKAVRDAAKECAPRADKLNTRLYLDADLAAVVRAYAAKNEPLVGDRKRMLADWLRDFRRNGLELQPKDQERLRALNDELVKLGQDFEENLAKSVGKITVTPKQLAGLPKEYVAKHEVKDGKVEITTDYPDYFPFITYAKDRKAALAIYIESVNRGGDANVKLLETLLAKRAEKAKLLGYATWADYAIEPRMAKTSKAVRGFLDEIRTALKEPAKAEMAELVKVHTKLGGKKTDKLTPPDRYYLEDQVKATKFKFDSKEIADYLEISAVTKGLLDITSKMYGLEYKRVPDAKTWHPDVMAYDVLSGGKTIGRFYLDLYSRPDKYKHAAMFPIRTPRRLEDGRYVQPTAALECNFPKPGAEAALMSHEDVVTFFHEFGHVLHHLLTQESLASYAGSNTVRDFVEAPSQMFEEWPWSREVLDLFARHHKTGAKIPDKLFDAMKASRSFGLALSTQRQVFLASLDQELHTRNASVDRVDSTKVVEEVQNATDSFQYVPGTHFQSSFGHLIGYDAGYYSYQWALALSRDVLTRFQKEGLLNTTVAGAWRTEVLEKGGGTDERALVTKFLGREPNNEAYFKYLRGGT